MRLYLAVSSPHPIQPGVAEPRRPELVMSAESGPWRSFRWTSRDGATRLLAWSNEPDDPRLLPALREEQDSALGCPGYFGAPGDIDRLLRAADIGAAADQLSGVFGAFRAGQEGFEAITTAVRLHPVYHVAAGELVLASNSALLVQDAASPTGSVAYDLRALQSLVRSGYFLGDETPYEGVKALPAHSTLVVRCGRRRIDTRPIPQAIGSNPGGRARNALIGDLADALQATTAPLRAFSEPISLALTGGRDSRLIAATLYAARVPFRTFTSGLADHPDVVLAQRIASRLGVSHDRIPPTRDEAGTAAVVSHPLVRTWELIRVTDGMISAHNNVARLAPFELVPRASGAGGEQLRGGFLASQPSLVPPAIRWRVRHLFLRSRGLFTERADQLALANLAPWEERARRDPLGALDRIYLYYRSGRWSASGRAASSAGSPTFNFLFDNRLNRLALAMSPAWRRSEQPVHQAIARLAPALDDLPLTGKRWRYQSMPIPWAIRPGWSARAPLRASGFDWRNQPDAAVLGIFREQILDGPAALFEIIRRPQVEALLARRRLGTAHAVLAWNIYTVAVLLSGRWLDARPALSDLRVAPPLS